MSRFKNWLRSFIPVSGPHISRRERLRSCLGALIGIALTAGFTRLTLGSSTDLPLLVAPMGASAVLLFAVPASPLAQPWSLIGGNLVSALVGVTCARWLDNPVEAAAIAIALAIACMIYLRCIHPPSGAVALTAVLGGPAIHAMGYSFVLAPIALNSVALLVSAIAYHSATRHRYPHHQTAVVGSAGPKIPDTQEQAALRADLDAVLEQRDEMLDVDIDDLQEVLGAVEARAYRRHMRDLTCENIMAADVKAVTPDMHVDEAWALLHTHKIKALPVIDAQRRVIGIVTQMDFVKHVSSLSELAAYVKETDRPGKTAPSVEEMMTKNVKTASLAQPIADLVPLFADYGHHHLPVVDAQRQLRGMVTQSNVVAGLHRHAVEELMAAAA